MSYRLSHIGEAEEAAIEAAQERPQRSLAVVSLQLMGVALIPWVPVIGGVWAGKKIGGSDGAWLGGAAGLTVSVVAMSSMLRKIGS